MTHNAIRIQGKFDSILHKELLQEGNALERSDVLTPLYYLSGSPLCLCRGTLAAVAQRGEPPHRTALPPQVAHEEV